MAGDLEPVKDVLARKQRESEREAREARHREQRRRHEARYRGGTAPVFVPDQRDWLFPDDSDPFRLP